MLKAITRRDQQFGIPVTMCIEAGPLSTVLNIKDAALLFTKLI